MNLSHSMPITALNYNVIDSGPLVGDQQMAIDRDALHGLADQSDKKPTLRFFQWTEPTISYGYLLDIEKVKITVIFDGAGAPKGTAKPHSSPEMEILYSKAGQTADDIIERVTHRLRPYGDVLVVTDDFAERDTVIALGGSAVSCEQFVLQVEAVRGELQRDLKRVNRREDEGFHRPRPG